MNHRMCPNLSKDITLDHWKPGTRSCHRLKLLKQVGTAVSPPSDREHRELSFCGLVLALCVDLDTDTCSPLSISHRSLLPCQAPAPRGRSRRARPPGRIAAPSRTTESDSAGVFRFLIYFSILGKRRHTIPKGAYKNWRAYREIFKICI